MGLINAIANLYRILKISRLSIDAIEKIQEQQFRRLLLHAVGNSEYYQDLYKGIDVETCSLKDLPTVTKAAMMENYDRFVTDKRIKFNKIQNWLEDKQNAGKFYLGEYSPLLTSGSTGENALIVYHRKAIEIIQASLIANYPFPMNCSKYGPIQTIARYFFVKKFRVAVLLVPNSNVSSFIKLAPKISRFVINLKMFSLLDPLDEIVEALNEFKPDQLISNSFFLALLAQEQLAGRLNIAFKHPMAYVAGLGEVLTEHTRHLAEKAWNLKIQNTYGAAECFFIATSCSQGDNLHVLNHLAVIEIVDRKNRPVPPGYYGEKILLTNLSNFIQPIIRYEIDDVTGYTKQRCACGSSFPALLPIQGRAKDFFYFQASPGRVEKFPPNALTIALMYFYEIRQYQIVQTARNELTIIYVPQNRASDIEQKLKRVLKRTLAQRNLENIVMLKFKKAESISRNRLSGKFNPMISMGATGDLDYS